MSKPKNNIYFKSNAFTTPLFLLFLFCCVVLSLGMGWAGLGKPSFKKTTFFVTNVNPPLNPSCDKKPLTVFQPKNTFLGVKKYYPLGGFKVWPETHPP